MTAAPAIPLRRIAGRFWRAVPAARVASVLASQGPESAGRYHRPGQPALYLTPEPDWAVIAIGRHMAKDGVPRVVVPPDLSAAQVVDQHDPVACAMLGIDPDASDLRWQAEMAAGRVPPSWEAADAARGTGADGIVDRSRGIAGGWHVALFHWNVPGAPQLSVVGEPVTIGYEDARARWPAPPGWRDPRTEGSDG